MITSGDINNMLMRLHMLEQARASTPTYSLNFTASGGTQGTGGTTVMLTYGNLTEQITKLKAEIDLAQLTRKLLS